MGVVLDDSPGQRVLLYGADGSTLLKVVVDASGHLQVDALSSALPTGAATEVTLAEASARLGDEVGPAAGSVNKQLADLLVELQSVLDAAARLYGYDGAAWANILVESAASPNLRVGLWDGARRALVWDRGLDAGSVDDQTLVTSASLLGFNGSTWDRLRSDAAYHLYVNQFGVPGAESKSNLNATVGTNNLSFTVVAAGKVCRVTNIWAANFNSVNVRINVMAIGSATTRVLLRKASPVVVEGVNWQGECFLAAGDYIMVEYEGCTLNDDLYADIHYVVLDA